MPGTSEFRLLKTLGGRTSFARVRVTAEQIGPESNNTPASAAVTVSDDAAASEPPRLRAEWCGAAAAACAELLRRYPDAAGLRLRVEAVDGTVIDTTEDAVWCAAFFAAWAACFPGREPPPMSAERPWRVLFDM